MAGEKVEGFIPNYLPSEIVAARIHACYLDAHARP